jgi:hypothetical protein
MGEGPINGFDSNGAHNNEHVLTRQKKYAICNGVKEYICRYSIVEARKMFSF